MVHDITLDDNCNCVNIVIDAQVTHPKTDHLVNIHDNTDLTTTDSILFS